MKSENEMRNNVGGSYDFCIDLAEAAKHSARFNDTAELLWLEFQG